MCKILYDMFKKLLETIHFLIPCEIHESSAPIKNDVTHFFRDCYTMGS